MKVFLFLLVVVLLLCVGSVFVVDCIKVVIQVEMNVCVLQILIQNDVDFNVIYMVYCDKFNKVKQNQLCEVQLVWLKYCDLFCCFESLVSVGGFVVLFVL